MPGVSIRVSATAAAKPVSRAKAITLAPVWPALGRGLIVLISLAAPIVATLLSR